MSNVTPVSIIWGNFTIIMMAYYCRDEEALETQTRGRTQSDKFNLDCSSPPIIPNHPSIDHKMLTTKNKRREDCILE